MLAALGSGVAIGPIALGRAVPYGNFVYGREADFACARPTVVASSAHAHVPEAAGARPCIPQVEWAAAHEDRCLDRITLQIPIRIS